MGTGQPRDERAGCLTAWLILLLALLGSGSIFYFYTGVVLSSQGNAEAGRMAILLAVALSAGAAGAASLLARRRFGMYLLVAAFVFAGLLQFLTALRVDIALAGLINIGLLWWLVRPAWTKLE